MRRTPVYICLLASLVLLVLGCTQHGPTPSPQGSGQENNVIVLLATKTLRVGTQRLAFLLETPTALVNVPQVGVALGPPSGQSPAEKQAAIFHEWPLGTRGSYVTDAHFGEPGRWLLDVYLGDGQDSRAQLAIDVQETTPVRDVGELAPFSGSKTLKATAGDLSAITSHYRPDPDLYRISIAEALITGKPSVIAFASPAFCTSPTCGPEVETVSELKESYREEANFIHVEVYDNPDEIQGDLERGRLSPVLSEWGIDQIPGYRNESWVFVLGRDARIAARFEGYATLSELETALQAVL